MTAEIRAAFALAIALALGACREDPGPTAPAGPAPVREERTSAVLVTIDSLRADHLSCYGYPRPTSPNLDRLAATGALFESAIAQAPWTLPSLASLHTAKLPAEVGAIHNDGRVADVAVTAAELFRAAGYGTAAFTSGAYTEPSRGFGQGFEAYENLDRSHRAAELTRRALAWIDGHRGRPFFVWIHYFDVHADYAAPAPWNALFDATPPSPDVARLGHLMRVVNGDVALAPGELEQIETSYDREIAGVDAALGALWGGLEKRGLAERTALAVGADHGEAFLEHGLLLHTLTVYDELVRVPLVVRLPGRVPAGARVRSQVRNLDALPSLLDLAGIAPPPGLRGASLVPLASGDPKAAPGPAPSHTDTSSQEAHYVRIAAVRPGLFDTLFAARTSDAKLVYSGKTGSYRLFDLRADPGESTDVFAERGASFPELRRAVDELRAIAPPSAGDAPPATPSPAELEQLRQLGYVR